MLRVRGLGVRIGAAEILRDVGFDMAAGEIFGLLGESGSGKSMTALALMQLLPRGATLDGSVQLGRQEIVGAPERTMTDLRGNEIAMIFQEPMTALNPVQTVGDQVAETLIVHGVAQRSAARAQAREKLDRVGLEAFPLDRYPHELSGGQRQRVSIAMAIALRPQLLIADEPTTALDVTTQAQILALLQSLVRDEGMSLLLITHDLAVVAGMATRVAVMQAGQIVETGETEALYRRQSHPYTQALFAASVHRPARQPSRAEVPVLAAEGLRRDYPLPRPHPFAPAPVFTAVRDVSLKIRRGESVGLVGESGCGKSTLTRALLGLEPLAAGAVVIDGTPLPQAGEVPRHVRQKLQVVFQDPYGSFNPRHKVGRLVSEPFHLLDARPSDPDGDVGRALEAVGLAAGDAGRYIHEFSGGQRQRIAIARALIIRPKILIFDEAVSALDVRVRAQILDLIADLQKRFGLSYLFISHDLAVVEAVTDRVLVMQAGQIVEDGPSREVFTRPRHPYTKALTQATPRIPEDWTVGGENGA